MKYYLSITIAILCSLTVSARSNKRGIGWDEGSQRMNATALRLLQPGVAWIYNWSMCDRCYKGSINGPINK